MRSWLSFLFVCFAVAACSGSAFDFDLGLDFSEPDECKPAGGTCTALWCDSDKHAVSLSGCGFMAGCCLPGSSSSFVDNSSSSSSGSSSFGTVLPTGDGGPQSGFCDLIDCFGGWVCKSRAIDEAGTCEAVCEPPEASVDGGDAGDAADAGETGDGGACGAVTCGIGCMCLSARTSECACSATGCQK